MSIDAVAYHADLDGPMEGLAIELLGFSGDGIERSDAELVERATNKIRMLKDMLLATGMSEGLLAACMRG